MRYNHAPESYKRAYDRLKTELTMVLGDPCTRCRPAVFSIPENAELSAQAIHDAVRKLENSTPMNPVIQDETDGFYYASGQVWRPDNEPDIEIRADANSLRLFEKPYVPEKPLPTLSFEDFANIISNLESELEIKFIPYNESEDTSTH